MLIRYPHSNLLEPFAPPGLNIRRRPTNRQNDESTDQSQIAPSTGLNAINLDTAISIDDLLRLRPVEPPPAELTQLSDCLKNLNAELSSIQFQNIDQSQLNEQFKQQLCREIGDLRTKLDLVSDRYNLTADLQYKAADQPYGIAQAVQPLNTFILVPISLTQPLAGPALNQSNQPQPNQTQSNQMQSNQTQPSAELRCPGQLTNQSRPNKDDLMAQLNRAMLGQQLNQQMNQQQGQQPSQSNCPAASSSGGHYLFDDNFSRIGGLDEINQNRMLLASIHQKQQSKASLVQPANPDQQQKPVEFRLIKQSDGTVTVLNLVGRSDVQ